MTARPLFHPTPAETIAACETPLTRTSRKATREAWVSLSQTQRRLAHRYKRLADQAEQAGDRSYYVHCRVESDRLWRSAKWNLKQARNWS